MFMAEVKFLSFEGLETFLNKLKESFVLKSDYVASNTNFLQLKPDNREHNIQIINIYESNPSNSFLYMEMDGLCKIVDAIPSTTTDDNGNSVDYYELSFNIDFLNVEEVKDIFISFCIIFKAQLFLDGTLTEPTIILNFNKSSYCLDNLGDRYSIYTGYKTNVESLISKLESYLAEHEDSTAADAFKALSYLITLPHITKINTNGGGQNPFYTIVNFSIEPFGGYYFNENGSYIFSEYDLYSGFVQDTVIYEPSENSGSSGTEYTAGTGLTISGTTINHSNSISANETPALLKIQYDEQGHINLTSPITKQDIIDLGIPEYTPGDNITISGTTISAKDTTYEQGDNIIISGTTISATDTKYSPFVKSGSDAKEGLVPAPPTTEGTTKYLCEDGTWAIPLGTTYTPGDNITIISNVISAKDTIYDDSFLSGELYNHINDINAHKNTTYTSGDNIQISDNVISAIDTTYEVFKNEIDGLVPAPKSESKNENLFLCADGTWKTIKTNSIPSNDDGSGLTTTGTLEYFNSNNESTNTETTDTGDTSTESTNTETTDTGDTSTDPKKLYIVFSENQLEYSTTNTSSKLYLTEDGIYFCDQKVVITPELDSIEIPNVPHFFELKMNDAESNILAFEQIFAIKESFDPAVPQDNSGTFAYMNMQALFSGLTVPSGVNLGFSVSNVIFDSYNMIETSIDSADLLLLSFNKDFPISISFEGLNLNLKIKINVFFDATPDSETYGQLINANMAIDHNKSSYNLEDPLDLLALTVVNCVQSCFFLMMHAFNQGPAVPLITSALPTTCPNVIIVKYQDVISLSISTLDLLNGEGASQTQTITVNSTDNWSSLLTYKTSDSEVVVSEDWIRYSPTYIPQAAEEDFIQGHTYVTDVEITVESNYVDEFTPTPNRSATITFSGGYLGAATATLTINQAGYNPPVEGEEPEQPSGDICEDCDCDGLFDEMGYGFMRYYPETIYQVLSVSFISTFGGIVAQYRDRENKLHTRVYSIDAIMGGGSKPIDEIMPENNSSSSPELENKIEELETYIDQLENTIQELEEKLNENPINYKIIINNKDNYYSNILDYIIERPKQFDINNFEIIQNTDKADYTSTFEIYHGSELIHFLNNPEDVVSTEAKSIELIENIIKRYKPNYGCFGTGSFAVALVDNGDYTFELDVNGTDQNIMTNGGLYGNIIFTVEYTADIEIVDNHLENEHPIEQRTHTENYTWEANTNMIVIEKYEFKTNNTTEFLLGGSEKYRISSINSTDSKGYSYFFIFN